MTAKEVATAAAAAEILKYGGSFMGSEWKHTDHSDIAPEAEMFIYRSHSDECDRKRAAKAEN